MEKILPLAAGTRVQMKKKHPCGASVFLVLRAGADVKARCSGCGVCYQTCPIRAIERIPL